MWWKLSNMWLTMNQLLYTAGNCMVLNNSYLMCRAKKKDLMTQCMEHCRIFTNLIADEESQRVWMAYEMLLSYVEYGPLWYFDLSDQYQEIFLTIKFLCWVTRTFFSAPTKVNLTVKLILYNNYRLMFLLKAWYHA